MDNREAEQKLTGLLRLEEYPTAIKFAKTKEDFRGVKMIPKKGIYSCQVFKIASTGGFAVGADADSLACLNERVIFGIATEESMQNALDIEIQKYAGGNKEIGKKMIEKWPKLKCIGVMAAPLSKTRFHPDVVMLTVDAWKTQRLIHAYTYHDGEDLIFRAGTNATPCAYGAVYVTNTGKPNLAATCSGAREYGKYQTDDIAFFIPYKDMEKVIKGLEETDKTGLKVPHFIDFGVPTKKPKELFEAPEEQR